MSSIQIRNALLINEGERREVNVLIENQRISKVEGIGKLRPVDTIINAKGQWLLPGAIDDQVHFREPGLTHKADLFTESRAAVAGGVTSFMEMPNTSPAAITRALLEEKYSRAAEVSHANYSFFLGATANNIEELNSADYSEICGVKIFMGSSTGDLLVDEDTALENIFCNVDGLIATHCEDNEIIATNTELARAKYGEDIPISMHPNIRSRQACYASSSKAVALAKKHGSRLHILHISTADELALFESGDLKNKKITAEACVHHLWFSDEDYQEKGTLIKWNPAVKTAEDRNAIRQALIDGRIDVVATDHAPHTLQEKDGNYFNAPSGAPLVQHSIVAMLEMARNDVFSVELVVEKMSHSPALLFNIVDRGYVREGYFADLVLVDPNASWTVNKKNLLYKCGWSPLEGTQFNSEVKTTIVNGAIAYHNREILERRGSRLRFKRV